MNRIKLIIVLLVFSAFNAISVNLHFADSYESTVILKGFEITVEVVYTDDAKAKGLMFRESLDPKHGMLFIFEREDYRIFWMKNMNFAIDIIFIDRFGFIVDIKKNFEPCQEGNNDCPSYSSRRRALYALEVVAGFSDEHGIEIGDSVIIK